MAKSFPASNWLTQSSLNAPSEIVYALLDNFSTEPSEFSPFGKVKVFSKGLYRSIARDVIRLFLCCRPANISLGVITRATDSINRVLFTRPAAYVGDKLAKGYEFVSYSFSAIQVPVLKFGVVASIFECNEGPILDRVILLMVLPVAAATCSFTAPQISQAGSNKFAAITSTGPSRVSFSNFGNIDGRKFAEPLSRKTKFFQGDTY